MSGAMRKDSVADSRKHEDFFLANLDLSLVKCK